MHQDRVVELFKKMYKRIGSSKWDSFIDALKKQTTSDEPTLVLMSQFMKVLEKFGVRLSERQQEQITLAFPRG
jgi:Ca2+-binding EF-hand superfamily protein